MKKIISFALLALAAVALPLSLVGCGKKSNSSIVGTWKYSTWEVENVEGEYSRNEAPFKESDYENKTLTFKKDGTLINSSYTGGDDQSTFKWEKGKNNEIVVTRTLFEKGAWETANYLYEFKNGKLAELIEEGKDGRINYIVKIIYEKVK